MEGFTNSTADIQKEDLEKLFASVKIKLGAPLVKVELNDEMLESLYHDSVEEISAKLNDWLVKQQWSMISGIDMTRSDLLFALTTKGLDWERSFTYAYSKQTGLDESGTYELKKDFFEIRKGQQIYNIPAGREINEVLWYGNVSNVEKGQFMQYGGRGSTFGGSYNSWMYGNTRLQFMLPLYGTLAFAQHAKMSDRIYNADMTYKITGGPNGSKNIHLYPEPFGPNDSSRLQLNKFEGYKVWYFYYEPGDDRDKCLEENDDIVRLPSDARLSKIKWRKFSESFQNKIKRLLIAKCKQVLGMVRGKFSGEVNFDDAQRTLDYRMLLDEGQREEERVYEELGQYLEGFMYVRIMDERAQISESLNRVLQNVPFRTPFKVI